MSNTLYAKYCASRTQQAERYLALTGIRELRAYCQLVPAEAQMEAISTLLKHEVRPLILSLRQWALSGADSVTAERAAGLRVLISNVERTLLQV